MNVGVEAKIDLELWLTRGALAAHRGDLVTARRIFRALSRLAPFDRRVWIGLARVAESVAERAEALQRAECVTTAPLPLPPALSPTVDISTTTVSVATHPPPESVVTVAQPAPLRYRSRWWFALFIILPALLAGWWLMRMSAPATISITPPTIAAIGPLPDPAVSIVVTVPAIAPSPPHPTPSPVPSPLSAHDTRNFGQFVIYENWRIALLRPEDVVIVDGELGTIHVSGRVLIALLAVSNEAPVERVLPIDLFAVEDEMGQHYLPLPGASTDYLEQFGRGMYGDLALEDRFTPQSGLRSVPILFELPRNRKPLRLWVGNDVWLLQ